RADYYCLDAGIQLRAYWPELGGHADAASALGRGLCPHAATGAGGQGACLAYMVFEFIPRLDTIGHGIESDFRLARHPRLAVVGCRHR
nr:hypothetical protein [Tanacetum cinerariifolium]